MPMGISQRDIQNYETPAVTAVIPPVSTGEVVGENLSAVPKGLASGVESTWQALATGATSAIMGVLPDRQQMFSAANAGMPVPETMAELDPEQIRVNQALDATEAVNRLKPDPRKSGTAANILYGLTSGVTRFIAGSVATGSPLGGAALVGATEGTGTRNELLASGVDRKTADMLGLGSGVFAGTAALLPGGYGKTLASRVTSGAVAQLSLGVSQREMMSAVLAGAGYKDQAAQYRPLDGASMMADAVLGATFGLLHHAFAPPEAVDSAHTIKDAQQVEKSAGGPAVDSANRDAVIDSHVAAAEKLLEDSGEPPQTKDVRVVPDPVEAATREKVASEADAAAKEAGAKPVEMPDMPEPELPEGTGEEASPTGSLLGRGARNAERAKAEGETAATLDPATQDLFTQAQEVLSRRENVPVHDENGAEVDARAELKREMDNFGNAASDGVLAKVAAACAAR
jgi:hypothetical protein